MLKSKLFLFAVSMAGLVACGERQSDCPDISKISDEHEKQLCVNHQKMVERHIPKTLPNPKDTKAW